MDKRILDNVRIAVATGINKPLLDYFRARLDDIKNDLIACSEGQYKELRGRALENQELIKLLESVKE
jgi:hypothetical protein